MASNVAENIDGYEFSDNQKRLWNVAKEQLSAFYNQVVLTVQENKTSAEVLQAIRTVFKAHEVFTFRSHNNYQYYYPVQYQYNAECIDYKEIDGNVTAAQTAIETYLSEPFQPSENAGVRFCFTMQDNFVKTIHIRLYSLWGDTYSALFLAERMNTLLNATENTSNDADAIPYINYAAWQNDLIKNPEDDAQSFWKTYADEKGKTIIPFQKAITGTFTPKRKQIAVIDAAGKKELETVCAGKEGTLSNGLFYQYLSFLATFTKENVTVGYVQNDRTYDELKSTLGFVNKTLPVVLETASIIENGDINMIQNQIEQVTNWSDYYTIKKDNPQQCFNYCFECISAANETTAITDVYSIQNTFRVKLSCVVYADKIVVDAYYDTEYYSENDIAVLEAQLKKHFTNSTLQPKKTQKLSTIENEIIKAANSTSQAFESYNAITELIDEQVAKNPKGIAIAYDSIQFTYQELQEKVNKLANHLVNQYKVSKGDAVCILLDRSEAFIVSLLSVLKTGAYYVPISKEYPLERVRFILEDTACKLLLTDVDTKADEGTTEIETFNPERVTAYENEAVTFKTNVQNTDTAYCIYTSGSTGKPKGCLISHKNILNYISWANQYYFTNADLGNWGFFTAVSFDLSVTAIFTSLTRGKRLTIEKEGMHIAELLKKNFEDPTVDTLKLTPAHLSLLAELDIKETAMRVLICGGEQLTQQQVNIVKAISPDITLFNEYGPTEATVGCITKVIEAGEKVSIGTPIANMSAAIVNDQNEACEIGATGELILSGTGISKGYLNRDDITAEKFVNGSSNEDRRQYKTGDLARWTANGNIEFLGRIDDQVKIRGYRIELAEIENCLSQFDIIDEAVVVVRENDVAEKELVAYIRAKHTLDAATIQEYLAERIPEYMLPEHYVQLITFPLTINGKVDRKALPEPYGITLSSGAEYREATTETESKLVTLWEDILKREQVGVDDNFFLIGGNSLKAMTVINHIHKTFEIKLQLKDFFESATIADIATQIDSLIVLQSLKEEMNSEKEFESEIIL
ncbi:amino acid adenylation domain-containing protein [Kordia sp.]|uniref:non-ribosomal peptide synthetase family protein n=1 Tax=Kordia sp. TaxID=1965332 RepID=UPI003D6B2CA0